MPHIFSQLPFPKASLAILEVFTKLAGITLDFNELAEQTRIMQEQLGGLLARVEQSMEAQLPQSEEEFAAEVPEEKGLADTDKQRIEALFHEAQNDRAKAFELKQELDRLGVFKDYEDRLLDLFPSKKPIR